MSTGIEIKLDEEIVVDYGDEKVKYDWILVTHYYNSNQTAVILSNKNPSYDITLSVNLPPNAFRTEIPVDVNSFIVKALIPKLISSEILTDEIIGEIQSGYVVYPVYSLGALVTKHLK